MYNFVANVWNKQVRGNTCPSMLNTEHVEKVVVCIEQSYSCGDVMILIINRVGKIEIIFIHNNYYIIDTKCDVM